MCVRKLRDCCVQLKINTANIKRKRSIRGRQTRMMVQQAVAIPDTRLSRNKWIPGVVADTQSSSRPSLAIQKVPGQPELYNPCLGMCWGGGEIKKIIKDQKETRSRHK